MKNIFWILLCLTELAFQGFGKTNFDGGARNTSARLSASVAGYDAPVAKGIPGGSNSKPLKGLSAKTTGNNRSADKLQVLSRNLTTSSPLAANPPRLALVVTPGACQSATNTYTLTGTLSLTNAVAASLTITDGSVSTVLPVNEGQTTASFSLTDMPAGSGSRTITVTGSGFTPTSTTTGPFTIAGVNTISCTNISATERSIRFEPVFTGLSSSPVTFSVVNEMAPTTNPGPYTLRLFIDNPTITLSAQLGGSQSTYQYKWLEACGSGSSSTYTASATYSAPASCSVAPQPTQPKLALNVSPGTCQSATNTYTLTGTLSLTNATAASLTVTDGSATTTIAITAGQTTASFNLTGLLAGSGDHTVIVSGGGYSPATANYTAPASCSVAPQPTQPKLALSVTAGTCQSATNQYTLTGTLSLTNATAASLTIADGSITTIVAITAGQTTASFNLTGLLAGSGDHTVIVSGGGYSPATANYTAPTSCSVAPQPTQPKLALNVSPGSCQSASNTYTLTGTLSLTNATAASLTVTDGSATTTLAITAGQTTANFNLTGLLAGSGDHTVIVSGGGYSPATANYTAPASCSVAPQPTQPKLALSVSPGSCQSASNTYTLTGTLSLTNATAASLTVTDGSATTIVAITAGQTTANFNLTGLLAGSGNRSVTVSGGGYSPATVTYTAPASCTVDPSAPEPKLALSVAAGNCNSATNTYILTGTLSLTNATAASLTIADGSTVTTLAITAGQTTASFSLSGLQAGSGNHTVTVSGPGYTPTSTTSTAPFSIVGVNTISCSNVTATQRLVRFNPKYTGLNGSTITFVVVNEMQSTTSPGPYSLNLFTDNPSVTLSAQQGGTQTTFRYNWLEACNSGPGSTTGTGYAASTTYAAPASCMAAPPCSLVLNFVPGACNSASNQYAITGTVTAVNNTSNQTITISDGNINTTITVSGNSPTNFILPGLFSDGIGHTLVASSSSCGTTSSTYTAPVPCSSAPLLAITKQVDKARASKGDILTYKLVLTNKGTSAASNIVVRDSVSTGLIYVANSAVAPSGTTFTPGTPVSVWTMATLSAGQSLTLTFQARADSSGILYNQATIPGDVATACTSIPVKVCTGDTYVFRLVTTPGRSNYRWFRNDVEIAGQTSNVLNVIAPGIYSLAADNVSGKCPDFSCCPFIVEEDVLPVFQATAVPSTCENNNAQNNGRLVVSGFSAGYKYQYSAGTDFNPSASLSGAPQTIPANGILVSNLPNPTSVQPYTIRVYNNSGCYTDVTVSLAKTTCAQLALAVSPGTCQSATNTYTLTGTLSLTNAMAASLTIADGGATTTLAITAGQTTAGFSLTGMLAGSGNHTVSVTGAGYTTTSATYSAPASCSVAPPVPPPGLALAVSPGTCQSATNTYTLTGTLSLTNATAASLTIVDGSATTTVAITAGQTTAGFSLTGLLAGSGNHTV